MSSGIRHSYPVLYAVCFRKREMHETNSINSILTLETPLSSQTWILICTVFMIQREQLPCSTDVDIDKKGHSPHENCPTVYPWHNHGSWRCRILRAVAPTEANQIQSVAPSDKPSRLIRQIRCKGGGTEVTAFIVILSSVLLTCVIAISNHNQKLKTSIPSKGIIKLCHFVRSSSKTIHFASSPTRNRTCNRHSRRVVARLTQYERPLQPVEANTPH